MPLVRIDPYRNTDRWMLPRWSDPAPRRTPTMAMDAYRKDDRFLLRLDLPGVDPDSIELTVEDSVLSIEAERLSPWTTEGVETLVAERPFGRFTRQVVLGTNLDVEHIEADYEHGVLTVAIPVAPHAKARRIAVNAHHEAAASEVVLTA